MKTALLAVAAAALALPGVANAAAFTTLQLQTVPGQNFSATFAGTPAPDQAGTIDFLVRGDFSAGFPGVEYLSWDLEGVVSGQFGNTGPVPGGNQLVNYSFNDNLLFMSYALTLAQLQAITANGSIDLFVDYSSDVDADLSRNPFMQATIQYATGAVPEPATWAMMIGGFGLVGGALRRRRATKVTYA